MSEDILSDPPTPSAPTPAAPSPPGSGDAEVGENVRRRPRPRGGRGRKGGPGAVDGEGDEPVLDDTSGMEITETAAAPGPPEVAPATDEAPNGAPGLRALEPRPPREPQELREPREPRELREPREPRDPRDPRRDARPPRPDQRPPRQDPRDHRRDLRPPRPEHREPRHEPRHEPRPPRPERPDRTVLDPNELSDMAWQLFFGELREEGLALVDDADAEKLTNRCFKLAESFLRTRQRRLNQLFGGGTTSDERQRDEPRAALPPKPRTETPIEKRLPDDPSQLSKIETEALIDEAQEAAAAQPEPGAAEAESTAPAPEESQSKGIPSPAGSLPTEPPSADDGGD